MSDKTMEVKPVNIMYLCDLCDEESSCYQWGEIRIDPNGQQTCEICYDSSDEFVDDPPKWDELPRVANLVRLLTDAQRVVFAARMVRNGSFSSHPGDPYVSNRRDYTEGLNAALIEYDNGRREPADAERREGK